MPPTNTWSTDSTHKATVDEDYLAKYDCTLLANKDTRDNSAQTRQVHFAFALLNSSQSWVTL